MKMKEEKDIVDSDGIILPVSTGKMSPNWDKFNFGPDGELLPEKTAEEKELDEFIEKSRAVEEKMDDDKEDLYLGDWKNRKKEVKN